MIKFIKIILITIWSFVSIAHADTLIVKEYGRSLGFYAIDLNDGKCDIALSNLSSVQFKTNRFNVGYIRSLTFTCMNRNGEVLDYGTIYRVPIVDNKNCLAWSQLSGVYLQDRCDERELKFRELKIRIPLSEYVKSLE